MADSEARPPWEGGEDDVEEEDIDETGYKAVKDAIIFAIDVSDSMLKPTTSDDPSIKDTDSPTLAALKCAHALMQQRIISHPNDMMGILLFGTEQSKFRPVKEENATAEAPYPHCYVLMDLDIPSAGDVKRLRQLIGDEEDSATLLKPHKGGASIANVLFCANQIFQVKAANFSSRRLFLVTDNDDPHKDDSNLRSNAVVRAKDLSDLLVLIELFPISTKHHQFDRTKFYDDLTYNSNEDPEAPAPLVDANKSSMAGDGISLLASLLSSIMSRSPSKRALFSNVRLELGPDLAIGVKGYIIFKRQEMKRSCYIWMDGEKPQIAIGTSTKSNLPLQGDDAPSEEKKKEIRKAYKFGGENILFTQEEHKKLREFEDKPVIRIIGFKPLSSLPLWANIRPSTFIYPSEESFVGSTRVFSALHQSLLRKQKMGLVWYIARKNATPVIAALVPGVEEKDPKTNEQSMPPGLWICPLPYADDIRPNPELSTLIRAPDVLKDKMRDVVLNLQLPGGHFAPERYPNPQLQWHYKVLQAMALEEDIPEKADDKTIPKYRQIDKRVGQTVLDWGVELEDQIKLWREENRDHLPGGGAGGSKRGAGKTTTAAKRPKVDDGGGDGGSGGGMSDEAMKDHFKKDKVKKLTVAVLKEWLGGHGLSVSGKKDDLVTRVEQHFENKMDVD